MTVQDKSGMPKQFGVHVLPFNLNYTLSRVTCSMWTEVGVGGLNIVRFILQEGKWNLFSKERKREHRETTNKKKNVNTEINAKANKALNTTATTFRDKSEVNNNR